MFLDGILMAAIKIGYDTGYFFLLLKVNVRFALLRVSRH